MEILNTVFTFVSNNILTKAEFFVGLIVLVGYILLGRKWYENISRFLKSSCRLYDFKCRFSWIDQHIPTNPCRIKPESFI